MYSRNTATSTALHVSVDTLTHYVIQSVHGVLLAGHVIRDEIASRVSIGRLAVHQTGKGLPESGVLPSIDDGVQAGVDDGEVEGDLVAGGGEPEFVAGTSRVDGDDEVGKPAYGKASQNYEHHLKIGN